MEKLDSNSIIYLDNAATTWPKPVVVLEAMIRFLTESGGSPGRSSHRLAQKAGVMVLETRDVLASFVNAEDPSHVIFTKNGTEAINLAIQGLLKPGDRVVTSAVEHNSVMRPLRQLEAQGKISLDIIPCDPNGQIDMGSCAALLQQSARLVVMTHASNVIGITNPIEMVGKLAHSAGAKFLVDAAQTIGVLPIDMQAMSIDLLAFPGHKSLFGPTGTGALVIGDGVKLNPIILGGTGSMSEKEIQPDFLPDALESGTLNAVGLAGLLAGLMFIQQVGQGMILKHERSLMTHLISGLKKIPGIKLFGPNNHECFTNLISFNIDGLPSSEVGMVLDETYGIMCRVGLHCAPSAHKTLGTFPDGTVRFSLGYLNSVGQIDKALEAVRLMAKR